MPRGVYERKVKTLKPIDPAEALEKIRTRAMVEVEGNWGRPRPVVGPSVGVEPGVAPPGKNVRRRFDPLRVFIEQRKMARRQKEMKALARERVHEG